MAAADHAADAPTSLPAEAAGVLARGGQVLTANARAARSLLRAYGAQVRAQGLRSWRSPAIAVWSEWLGAEYERVATERDLPVALSELEELALWKRVQQAEAARVVAPHRLAKLAAEAWALVHEYGATLDAEWFTDAHEDAAHFRRWAAAFERECTRLGVVSRAQRAGLLARDGYAPQAIELLLVGFDRLSPAQAALLRAMEKAGIPCALHVPAQAAATGRVIEAADTRAEMEACALWARAQLAEEPTRRLGVLAPQLAAVQADLDRVLRRVLLPESSQRAAAGSAPYEFSLGAPLAHAPNVAAALLLLRWLSQPLNAAEISTLLLGDFVAADPEEALRMAAADVRLRGRGKLSAQMSVSALLRAAGTLLPEPFRRRVAAAQAQLGLQERRARPWSEWADATNELVERAGWPGFRERSSVLFQAENAWRRLLDEVARLGATGERVPWNEFLDTLQQAARDRLFAAETQDAPVQVVGLAEAAGQRFDAVWVLGITEERWPPRGRMHPMLPPVLQRAHGMPYADREADRSLAETQLRRAAACAPVVTWSYALADNGVEQRRSPMLALVAGDTRTEPAEVLPLHGAPLVVRTAEDLRGPAWPRERIAGGSEVLRSQAACGFQAFARVRLGAGQLENETWGLDLRSRAVLLHRALELLWSDEPVAPGSYRLHTLDDLLAAIAEDRLHAYVTAAVTDALRGAMLEAGGAAWDTRFLTLEATRQAARILTWLDNEQARAWFRVTALEKRVDATEVGGLRLRLRLDRADALADGTILLLDYKSGDGVSVHQWEGERPDEPQLPLYALAGGLPHVSAIGFAQVRAGKTCLHAVAEQPAEQLGERFAPREGKQPKHLLTAEMRTAWEAALLSLARSFLAGDAPVNPKHGAQTCRYCGLWALCRVRQQRYAALREDEEEADA